MIALRLRINDDGRTVRAVPPKRPSVRPVVCPAPATVQDLYRASQVLLHEAFTCQWGTRTIEGTIRHASAIRLEQARMIHHVSQPEGEPLTHIWEITELGRFEWDRIHGGDK